MDPRSSDGNPDIGIVNARAAERLRAYFPAPALRTNSASMRLASET